MEDYLFYENPVFKEIQGKALGPLQDLSFEVTKLSVMLNVLLSTYSAADRETILAEYNRRLSEIQMKLVHRNE